VARGVSRGRCQSVQLDHSYTSCTSASASRAQVDTNQAGSISSLAEMNIKFGFLFKLAVIVQSLSIFALATWSNSTR
jgi:hypothetical protein